MPGMKASGDMSRCPEQEPVQNNGRGQACPLALVCSSSILAHEDNTASWGVELSSRELSYGFLQESQSRGDRRAGDPARHELSPSYVPMRQAPQTTARSAFRR